MELESNKSPSQLKDHSIKDKGACGRLLAYLDQWDKYFSGKLQHATCVPLECVLIYFTLAFNRANAVLTVFYVGLPLGYWRYEMLLETTGFADV